ncbi:MAG: transcriptional regulator [Acidobacteriales bacterium]|nr:transcriptional regulator [Terriglobales bacterium]
MAAPGGTVARTHAARANPRAESASSAGKGRERPVPGEIPELDRLIHERVRLGIISALAVNDSLSFNDLKRLLHTTDGNLSVHARKLEEGGYLTCRKFFEGRIPRTEYRLTAAGRRALDQYLHDMEEVIRLAREA